MHFYHQNTDYSQAQLSYELGNRTGMMLQTIINYYHLPVQVSMQTECNSQKPIELRLASGCLNNQLNILECIIQMVLSLNQTQQNSLFIEQISQLNEKDNSEEIHQLKIDSLNNLTDDIQFWNKNLFIKIETCEKNFFGHLTIDNESLANAQTAIQNQLKVIQRELKQRTKINQPNRQLLQIVLANKLYYGFLYFISQQFWRICPLLKARITNLIQHESFINVYGQPKLI